MKKRLSDLSIHPYNLEVYGEPDDGLKDSLAEFGLQSPVVIDSKRQILSGARRFAAAKALDWKTIETVPAKLNDAPVEKYILLANMYRDKKSNHLKYCEAQAWRALHDQETIDLIEDRVGGSEWDPQTSDTDRVWRLAATRAGLSAQTFLRMQRVLEAKFLDDKIAVALEADTIDKKQVREIKRKAKTIRETLRRDEVNPNGAEQQLRRLITDAEQDYKSEAERRLSEALEAISEAVKAADRFIVSLEKLVHKKHARYLTEAHAAQLYVKVQEIHHSLHALGKASRDLGGIERHGLCASD